MKKKGRLEDSPGWREREMCFCPLNNSPILPRNDPLCWTVSSLSSPSPFSPATTLFPHKQFLGLLIGMGRGRNEGDFFGGGFKALLQGSSYFSRWGEGEGSETQQFFITPGVGKREKKRNGTKSQSPVKITITFTSPFFLPSPICFSCSFNQRHNHRNQRQKLPPGNRNEKANILIALYEELGGKTELGENNHLVSKGKQAWSEG